MVSGTRSQPPPNLTSKKGRQRCKMCESRDVPLLTEAHMAMVTKAKMNAATTDTTTKELSMYCSYYTRLAADEPKTAAQTKRVQYLAKCRVLPIST